MKEHYAIRDTLQILDNPQNHYILKVRDLPLEEKPREKLLKLGAQALSIQELIAIILGSGSKKEEVMSMASRIVRDYGVKSLAGKLNPEQMSEDLGIPLVKCLQIAACAELGKRFFRKTNDYSMVRTSKDVYEYVADMRNLTKEHLRGLYLNSHYRVIHDEVISIGTVDANMVHPREVFRPALEYSAAAVILVHNHPSGSLIPSAEDRKITTQLCNAGSIMGIELLDHVIVSREGYKSILDTLHHD